MKKLILLGSIMLLVGCEISDTEYELAKSEISEDITYNFFRDNYNLKEILYEHDGSEVTLDLVDLDLVYKLKAKCLSKLNIGKENIEIYKGTRGGVRTSYGLIDSSKIGLDNYYSCVKNKVNSFDLEANDLYKMVNDPNYIKYKETPKIKDLINAVKSDNRVTIGEALNIYTLINNEIDKDYKQKYENTIRNL